MHRICFRGIENTLRTDESFRERKQKEHNVRSTVSLEILNIDLGTTFPIDYMHCVLLGVMRQILLCLIKIRKKPCSLKNATITAIHENLQSLRKCIPREFTRKQRTFHELEHQKATEFRLFLSYTGIAAFKGILPEKYYNPFLLLVCTIRILSNEKTAKITGNALLNFFKNLLKILAHYMAMNKFFITCSACYI